MAESRTRDLSAGGRGSQADDGGISRIRVLGRFTVEVEGEALPDAEMGNRKARLLLKLLVTRSAHHVPMDAIVEVLWPERAPAKAVGNVATLVSRLRRPLGTDVIEGGRSGYRLVIPTECTLDVEEAGDLVRESEARLAAEQPALAATAAGQALEMLDGGAPLEEESDAGDWLEEFRREVGMLLRRARAACWRANASVGKHRRSLAVAQDAVTADRFDEEAHRAVMLAYHRLGEPGEALAAYERLRQVLIDELGSDPGAETQALYLAVLRDEPVPDGTPTAAPTSERTVVGRDVELDTLVGAWDRAARGETGCVVMAGESGIGKTHLAEAFISNVESAGAAAVLARCYESEQSLFLQPVVEALRKLAGTLPGELVAEAAGARAGRLVSLVPDFGIHLGEPEHLQGSPEMERRRTFETVASFLVGVAKRRPLLVVLDDVHNAGASTLELIHFTLRWDRSAPLLIAVTAQRHRRAEIEAHLAGPHGTANILLGPLSPSAVRILAQDSGHPEVAGELISLTNGHTLFVLEALRAMSENGDLVIPDSLRDAVTARARRCGTEVEEFLRHAAVAGTAFDVEHMAELLGIAVEEAARRGEAAMRVGLLSEAGATYRFANEVVRDVLYETTPEPTRVHRHRRLSRLMHNRPEAAADHAAAATDWAFAIDRWLEAAERSLSAFANREAKNLLTRALDACTLVDDPVMPGRVQLLRGRALLGLARYDDATRDFAAVQTLARAIADKELEATALEELAWCAYHARQMDRAETLAQRALEHSAAGPRVQILAGRLHNTRGELRASVEVLQQAAATDDLNLRSSALAYLGAALAHSDRFDEARAVLDDAVASCELAGLLRPLLAARFFLSMTRANVGDLGGALDAATTLAAEADQYDNGAYKPRACNTLSYLWRELGEPERALDLAHEALESSQLPDGYLEAEPAAHARLALAESHLQSGDTSEAERWLLELSETDLPKRVAYGWRVDLRRLEVHCRLDPAYGEELLRQARLYESTKYGALALFHLGRREAAAELAATTGSDLLIAHVAPEPMARAAAETIAARLPGDDRERFLEHGPWSVPPSQHRGRG